MKYEITQAEVEAWNATYCKDCPMTHDEYRHSINQDWTDPRGSLSRGFNIGWNHGHKEGFENGYAVGFNDGGTVALLSQHHICQNMNAGINQ